MWLSRWKLVRSFWIEFFKWWCKVMFVLTALVAIIPSIFLAWRASQPMTLPQFNGLSYYQLLSQRRQAYENLAQTYQTRYPSRSINYLTCFVPDTAVQVIGALPMAGFYALAGVQPELKAYVNQSDIHKGLVPEHVTWLEFLPAWWETFEKLVWGMITHTSHGPVPYCRLSPP